MGSRSGSRHRVSRRACFPSWRVLRVGVAIDLSRGNKSLGGPLACWVVAGRVVAVVASLAGPADPCVAGRTLDRGRVDGGTHGGSPVAGVPSAQMISARTG